MAEGHSTVREGIYAGFIGATVIVLWFAIIDIATGQPFHTPNILGAGLLSVLGKPAMMPDTVMTRVVIYTIFHYAAFALVGVVVASIVHQSARTPAIRSRSASSPPRKVARRARPRPTPSRRAI